MVSYLLQRSWGHIGSLSVEIVLTRKLWVVLWTQAAGGVTATCCCMGGVGRAADLMQQGCKALIMHLND